MFNYRFSQGGLQVKLPNVHLLVHSSPSHHYLWRLCMKVTFGVTPPKSVVDNDHRMRSHATASNSPRGSGTQGRTPSHEEAHQQGQLCSPGPQTGGQTGCLESRVVKGQVSLCEGPKVWQEPWSQQAKWMVRMSTSACMGTKCDPSRQLTTIQP